MSNSRLRGAGRLAGVLALGLALVCGPATAAAKRTSPEDRARFVSITHRLEATPLDPALQADRKWALKWITDAPDISVGVCTESMGGLPPDDYPYAGELTLQYLFSMSALVIEHPETTKDENAQQLAGVEGAIKAYNAIVATKPDARLPLFETLLAAQAKGELPDLVRQGFARCTAQK